MAVGRGSGRGLRSLRAAIFGAVVVLTVVKPCAGQQTVTAPGGVAVGRDNYGSVSISGISPEALPGIIEAATRDWRNLSDQQKQTIDHLQNELGVNKDALRAFFAVLGEKEVPVEQLVKKLVEIAGSYKEALARAAPNPNDPPEIAKLRDAVKAALEAGHLDQADELLGQLEKLEDAALASQQAALASRQLERAGTSAQRGRVAMSQLRYQDAAQRFAEAAKHVPEARPDVRLGYLDEESSALYRQGDERGDNGTLREAIARFGVLLTLRPRERVPLEWAGTQMNLGAALVTLGARASGTARLEEAVAAYRAALEE